LSQLANIAIFMGLFLLVCGPVHECAHAYAAWRLGDGTARMFGRLTLNPVAHFDPVGALMILISSLAGFGIGWAKPTPVNPYNLRGRYGDAIVAAAGPFSNLVLAAIFAMLLRLMGSFWSASGGTFLYDSSVPGAITVILFYGVALNVLLMIFNLLPVPPLDGSHVFINLLDRDTAAQVKPFFDQYGFFIFILCLLPIFPGQVSVVGAVYQRIAIPIIGFLVGVPLG
jgi:Zn-dependent protease